MRFISSAARAFGLLIIFLTSSAFAGDRLTGADLHIMVRERLAGEGLSAAPVVNPKRLFPGCGAKLRSTRSMAAGKQLW